MSRPSTPAEMRAERWAMLTGTDPLSQARRALLMLYGMEMQAWVEGAVTLTSAMHATERRLLVTLAGHVRPENAPTVRYPARAWDTRQTTERRRAA